ncbi:protein kinase [Streptomyces sp. NPDC051976]|uniref:caspase, EACC1-associated type n=1 Tax=Streptomyces sp. NPDC051976 TaxID=3154947 RepID=UPI00341C83DD
MSPREDIDFGRSRAILLGTSEYTAGFKGRAAMPAALKSLAEMRKVLTGPCEWPKARISELPNQKDSGRLLRTITPLIRDVDDVLLFYYVGHGLPLPESGRYDLGLALTDTNDDPAHRALTSLRLRDLREQIVHHSTARIKVLILDCCSSGIATKYGESAANLTAYAVSATPVRGAGMYVWASCGHSQETYFEEKKGGLTYFTKYLSEAVREAHSEQSAGATVAHLHDEVRRRLRETSIPHASSQPTPDLHYSGRPDQFLFVRGSVPVRTGPTFRLGKLEDGDPRRVGPYELKARLGAGGIGRVFLAFTHGGHAIAVKLLKPELGQDPEFARRFGREVEVAAEVRSSHVAQLLDADPGAREPWLASSYVCGPSLLELVRESGPLPSRDVLLITAGIARALQAIHATGAVHRDLKPANVMLDETGPKVIDFGIAKSVAATLMTRTNAQLGTPAYKSPEQATGRKTVGPASDIFTLGATVYFLATGRDAFEAEDPLGLIHLIAHEEPELGALDSEVRDVVVRCLAKDPDARPTPQEVVAICTAATGPVTAGAYLRIAHAAPAINARAEALRALAPKPLPGDELWGGPGSGDIPSPFTPPVNSPHAETEVVVGSPPPSGPPSRPPSKSPSPTGPVMAGILALVCVLLLAWLPHQLAHGHSGNAADSGPSTSSPAEESTPATDPETPPQDEPSDTPTTDDPPTPTPTPTPSPTPSPTSTIEGARIGDCFVNDGTFEAAHLRAASCGNDVFQVAQVLQGTQDTSGCDGVPNTDYRLSYSGYDLVLCLTYRTSNDVYHARPGNCVFGPNAASAPWHLQGCQTGNFTVKARLTGTTDTSRCHGYQDVDEMTTNTTPWSQLDVVLCLSMNYPNAAARAPVGSCLFRSGSGSSTTFQYASCPGGNVVVTGRVQQYYDTAYCNAGHGWTTWRSNEFPSLAYTVCFRTT